MQWDYATVYNLGAFCSRSKRKTGRSYSLQEIKNKILPGVFNKQQLLPGRFEFENQQWNIPIWTNFEKRKTVHTQGLLF